MILAPAIASLSPADPLPTSLLTSADAYRGITSLYRQVTIITSVDGVLMEMPLEEGQRVEQGERLATIDDRGARTALRSPLSERLPPTRRRRRVAAPLLPPPLQVGQAA